MKHKPAKHVTSKKTKPFPPVSFNSKLPLKLVFDFNDVKIFMGPAGKFVLDRVTNFAPGKGKAARRVGEYCAYHQRQVVSREFAFQNLVSAMVPEEFRDLLASLLQGRPIAR